MAAPYERMADASARIDAENLAQEAAVSKVTPEPEHEEMALKALIAFAGSPSAASEALRAQYGITASPEELARMRDHTHAERYAALQESYAPDIEQAMVRELRELARAAMMGERLGIEKALTALPNMPPVPAAQIALNLSKIKQTNIDKLLALTGRPTTITESRSAEDLIRALVAKNILEVPE